MKNSSVNCVDPISPSEYPALVPFSGQQPILPSSWRCTALLHPFSPLQSNSTAEDRKSPFFELCTATIVYDVNIGMDAYLQGNSGTIWYYKLRQSGTTVSINGGAFTAVDTGWSIPGTNWFGDKNEEASCAGTSPLNWMAAKEVDWWKIPVGTSTPSVATWMWFDSQTKYPCRLMFGQGPLTSPTKGDPKQLALFQMFSFTYFTTFEPISAQSTMPELSDVLIEGFSFGNPENFGLFTWNDNFGMTAFMTPVNEAFNPLPTRVLYTWKSNSEYKVTSDRSQNTLMEYVYNPGNSFTSQEALLTGPAPNGTTPPPNSGTGFLINYLGNEVSGCIGHGQFPFGQEPPTWVQTPGVKGTIQATIVDNPALGPGNTITVVSVLFPPSPTGNNYPDSTYLWTWYSPMTSDGSKSRPVTFMQSQSQLSTGTSLALADYYYYEEFNSPTAPCNFAIPAACDQANVVKTPTVKEAQKENFLSRLFQSIASFLQRLFSGK